MKLKNTLGLVIASFTGVTFATPVIVLDGPYVGEPHLTLEVGERMIGRVAIEKRYTTNTAVLSKRRVATRAPADRSHSRDLYTPPLNTEDTRKVFIPPPPVSFQERRQTQLDLEVLAQLRYEAMATLGTDIAFLPGAQIDGLYATKTVGNRQYRWTSANGGMGFITHAKPLIDLNWLQVASKAKHALEERYVYTALGMFPMDFTPYNT